MTQTTTTMLEKFAADFPPGTPVRVIQTVHTRAGTYLAEVVGLVEDWQARPTGSWYAHGKNDRYWLGRLKLRKADGEITFLVIDDTTRIARLSAASG